MFLLITTYKYYLSLNALTISITTYNYYLSLNALNDISNYITIILINYNPILGRQAVSDRRVAIEND